MSERYKVEIRMNNKDYLYYYLDEPSIDRLFNSIEAGRFVLIGNKDVIGTDNISSIHICEE